MPETKPLVFSYDPEIDILTIEGVQYSGELFRALGPDGFEDGTLFRILSRDEVGTPTLQTIYRLSESDIAALTADLLDEIAAS